MGFSAVGNKTFTFSCVFVASSFLMFHCLSFKLFISINKYDVTQCYPAMHSGSQAGTSVMSHCVYNAWIWYFLKQFSACARMQWVKHYVTSLRLMSIHFRSGEIIMV